MPIAASTTSRANGRYVRVRRAARTVGFGFVLFCLAPDHALPPTTIRKKRLVGFLFYFDREPCRKSKVEEAKDKKKPEAPSKIERRRRKKTNP